MKSKFSKALVLLLTLALVATQLMVPVFATETETCACENKTVIETVGPTCDDWGFVVSKCDVCGEKYTVLTDEPTGVHNTVSYEAKAPTCTTVGWEAYEACKDCDYTTYVEIPVKDHSFNKLSVHSFCLEEGYFEITCKECEQTFKSDVDVEIAQKYLDNLGPYINIDVTAKGHKEVIDAAVDPTCTETGLTEGKHCERCEEVLVAQDVVDALGHTPSDAVKENISDAKCGQPGSYDEVVYCAVCGVEISRKNMTVDALEHDWKLDHVDEATCVEDGKKYFVCELGCGATKEEDIECVGKHDYTNKITQEQNCVLPEITLHTCKVCGFELEEQTKPAAGHKEVIDDAVAPKCTETGLTEGKHCEICGVVTVAQTVVAELGHKYVPVETAPTCKADGYITYTCSVCSHSYKEAGKPSNPLVHHVPIITKEAVAATCTATGLTSEVSCVYCEVVLSAQQVTDILPHKTVAVGAKDSTCTAIGWEAYEYCENCDYTTYVEIGVKPHTEAIDAAVAATCTETGLTEGKHCSVCDKVIVAQDVVDALGHTTWETIGITVPTCTEGGFTIKKCTVCEEIFKDDIKDALGHTLNEVDAKAATCTEKGWDAYVYCEVCDYTTYVEIAALGHDLKDVAAQKADCTQIGWDAYKDCSRCDYTEGYVEYAKTRHATRLVHGKEATCTEIGWYDYYECVVCDFTTYEEIAALGHDLVDVDAKAATCTEDGNNAYQYCKNCDYSSAKVIPAIGHDIVIDKAVDATYDETGLAQGQHCTRCDDATVEQAVVDRLAEEVEFTYEATGINGTEVAVNSGKVFVNVYMNVTSDFARLYAFDLSYLFDSNKLTFVGAESEAFDVIDSFVVEVMPIGVEAYKSVNIAPNMGLNAEGKTFNKGKYLVATLTFDVNSAFTGTADIELIDGDFARDTDVLKNELIVDFGDGAEIEVVKLGDANNDGAISSKDTLELAKWIGAADEGDYEAIYDLNKDGKINGDDFALLRKAAVGNTDYLN